MQTASERVREDYNDSAPTYSDYSRLPSRLLETELIGTALGDLTGLSVLDLGGGTGLHSQTAFLHGAAAVDLVDISPAMLEMARANLQSDAAIGHVRFFEADITGDLGSLGLREDGYDVVMGNWIFSHASTRELLDGMLGNISRYLKKGGKFVGIREENTRASRVLINGIYGVTCKDVSEIPGGTRYTCILHVEPEVAFEGTCLEVVYSGRPDIYEEFGLEKVEILPCEEAEVVKKDLEFWKPFLEQPFFAVVKAFKK